MRLFMLPEAFILSLPESPAISRLLYAA